MDASVFEQTRAFSELEILVPVFGVELAGSHSEEPKIVELVREKSEKRQSQMVVKLLVQSWQKEQIFAAFLPDANPFDDHDDVTVVWPHLKGRLLQDAIWRAFAVNQDKVDVKSYYTDSGSRTFVRH